MSTDSKQPKCTPVRRTRICRKGFPRADKSYVFYPELRLRGRWLQDNGFLPGQYLRIEVEEDRLILIRDREAEAQKRAQEAAAALAIAEAERHARKKPEPELVSGAELYAQYVKSMRARGLPLPGEPGHPEYRPPVTPVPYTTKGNKKPMKMPWNKR